MLDVPCRRYEEKPHYWSARESADHQEKGREQIILSKFKGKERFETLLIVTDNKGRRASSILSTRVNSWCWRIWRSANVHLADANRSQNWWRESAVRLVSSGHDQGSIWDCDDAWRSCRIYWDDDTSQIQLSSIWDLMGPSFRVDRLIQTRNWRIWSNLIISAFARNQNEWWICSLIFHFRLITLCLIIPMRSTPRFARPVS